MTLLEGARTTALLVLVATTVNVALLLPATIVVHLRAPRLRPVLGVLTLVPWLVPPTVLAVGVVLRSSSPATESVPAAGTIALCCALWALPFTYRTLDAALATAGVRAKYEAARCLGLRLRSIAHDVMVPVLRPAVGAACALTTALVLGEYVVASVLMVPTVSVAGGAHTPAPVGSLLASSVVVLCVIALYLALRAIRQHDPTTRADQARR